MLKTNLNFNGLKKNYLFSEIAERVAVYERSNPKKQILKLGLGDVSRPIVKAVVEAMKTAADEMGSERSFKGYPPVQGYPFLQEKIQQYYKERGIGIDASEVFISDGAKSDLGNIVDLFSNENKVLILDPVYPVYLDSNVMAGRDICFLSANKANDFLPMPNDRIEADLIYICSPNNPTGAAYTKEQLKKWVNYARKIGALIIYDAAYECFASKGVARSIFEVEGSKDCALEICSFSKMAGFTGLRCAYTVIPSQLGYDGVKLKELWLRRQATKFNGVSYLVQRGAEAVFSQTGRTEINKNLEYYKRNAKVIGECLDECGIYYTGGKNSPYIWMECPKNMKSWDFFDYLLKEVQVVGTPGVGFGMQGEGFFRLTAFGSQDTTLSACQRIKNLLY